MSTVIIAKLAAIFAVVVIGFLAGRTRMFGGVGPVQLFTNLAFYIVTPALLFRLTARIDLGALPWAVIVVYFVPTLVLLAVAYVASRRRTRTEMRTEARTEAPAAPAVRALSVTFSNTVQLGIPIVVGLFGEAGLAVHVAIISLHAVTLLTIGTVLVELDLARANGVANGDRPGIAATALTTARRAVLHPVVLPLLLGLATNLVMNLTGTRLPGPVDDMLQILGQAVVPVCLLLIGLSLAHYGVRGVGRAALGLAATKLLLMPALVLAAAQVVGLRGTALSVTVLCAALPIGSNPLLFAQRYTTKEAETTAAVVASTLAFAVTGPAWILAAAALG